MQMNTSFVNNFAVLRISDSCDSNSGCGGAICSNQTKDFDFSLTTFLNNSAGWFGGAIGILDDHTSIKSFENARFLNNSAIYGKHYGGIVAAMLPKTLQSTYRVGEDFILSVQLKDIFNQSVWMDPCFLQAEGVSSTVEGGSLLSLDPKLISFFA
jgi:hypothetical protein